MSLGIFEKTFAVTAALNTLTLLVSGVALFASLLTLSDLRLAQLAPVWAAGVTRRRLAELEVLKILVLAAVTAVLAVPLGLVLAWCLVAIVNVEAFGWRLPLHVFPGQWALIFALALLTAFLAALVPVIRLARTRAGASCSRCLPMNARPCSLIAIAASAHRAFEQQARRPEALRASARTRRASRPWSRASRSSSRRTSARIPTTASSGGT